MDKQNQNPKTGSGSSQNANSTARAQKIRRITKSDLLYLKDRKYRNPFLPGNWYSYKNPKRWKSGSPQKGIPSPVPTPFDMRIEQGKKHLLKWRKKHNVLTPEVKEVLSKSREVAYPKPQNPGQNSSKEVNKRGKEHRALLADQEQLWITYQKTKNIKVRNRLVELNIQLVRKYAHRLDKNSPAEYEDLEAEGLLGLIKAVERFDLSKGFAFSSFAVPYITGEMKRYLRDRFYTLRLPQKLQVLSSRVKRIKRKLEQTNGGLPVTQQDIADEVNRENQEADIRNKRLEQNPNFHREIVTAYDIGECFEAIKHRKTVLLHEEENDADIPFQDESLELLNVLEQSQFEIGLLPIPLLSKREKALLKSANRFSAYLIWKNINDSLQKRMAELNQDNPS